MVSKMYELGYLQNLDKPALPNVEKNLVAEPAAPALRPQPRLTVPWQSGMTGLIVNKELAPDVHSICDLFNPKYKGKVDFLNEVRETVPLVMKCEGVDPDKATEADWMKAIEKIKGAAESGQIRRFTGNDYARDLTSGDVGRGDRLVRRRGAAPGRQPEHRMADADRGLHALVGRHGDPGRGAEPDRGRGLDELRLRPEGQADIAEYVNYVTPVEGVKADPRQARPGTGEEPADLPERLVHQEVLADADRSKAKRNRR